jgi:hypothetical protein
MANMSDEQRATCYAEFASALSARREPCALIKSDLRAALNAADGWVEDNKASFNSALPSAAQSGLTASQKAELLMYVVQKRFNVGA